MRANFFLTPWQELREFETPGLDYRVFFLHGFLGAQADVGCGCRRGGTGETLLDPVRRLAS